MSALRASSLALACPARTSRRHTIAYGLKENVAALPKVDDVKEVKVGGPLSGGQCALFCGIKGDFDISTALYRTKSRRDCRFIDISRIPVQRGRRCGEQGFPAVVASWRGGPTPCLRRRHRPAGSLASPPLAPQVSGPSIDWTIKPAPGKMASVAIYAALASQFDNTLGKAAAQKGLEWYDEFVQEAKDVPGSHPNIDLLLRILDEGVEAKITVSK